MKPAEKNWKNLEDMEEGFAFIERRARGTRDNKKRKIRAQFSRSSIRAHLTKDLTTNHLKRKKK